MTTGIPVTLTRHGGQRRTGPVRQLLSIAQRDASLTRAGATTRAPICRFTRFPWTLSPVLVHGVRRAHQA